MLKKISVNRELDDIVDNQIRAVLAEMDMTDKDSEEYQKLITSLERLTGLRTRKHRKPLDTNTLVSVFGTLLSVLAIVAYEQAGNVIRTKAMDRVPVHRPPQQ